MTAKVAPETVQVAEQSYQRCLRAPDFFRELYRRLLTTHESMPGRFAHTAFDKQEKLLQHGIGVLFVFAKRGNPVILERIAERHNRRDVSVEPEMYPYFLDSLLQTVRAYDPEWTPEVEQAWTASVAPGVEFMKSRY